MRAGLVVAAFITGLSALPASAQQAPLKIAFEGDMVLGVTPRIKGPPPCVLTSQFKHGDMVVFRFRMTDPQTGKPLDASAVGDVTVEVSSGQKLKAKYGSHPPKNSTDTFWTAAWVIPKDIPTGTLNYKIVAATKNGASVSWSPFSVRSSQLTVVN